MPSPIAYLTRLLHQQWQHGGWLSTLLCPLGALTAWYVRRKRAAYASGKKASWRAPVPVIVIGNIYVGGTGKTPVTIAVVNALRTQGWHPGVVSRGYGVDIGTEPRCGAGMLDASTHGDEPALIAAATGAPIGIHPRRPLAAQALLARWPDTDILVCDDGLQHLALQRDIEIVVQDLRGIGNGRLLPAGPLREPAERLGETDAIVTNMPGFSHGATTAAPRGSHVTAMRAAAGQAPLQVEMVLAPSGYEHLQTGTTLAPVTFLADCGQSRLAAAAGIGNPDRYFAMLRQHGVPLVATLPLPDHHDYAAPPFGTLDADRILITAKDATKCRALNDPRLWVVHAEPRFHPEDWLQQLPLPKRTPN